jgi:hypothetical protein
MLQLVDRARREVVVHFSNSDVVGGEIEGDRCRAHGLVAFYQKKGLRRQRFIWFLSLAHKLKLVLVCERHLGCLESASNDWPDQWFRTFAGPLLRSTLAGR